jgi:hypothetical protein
MRFALPVVLVASAVATAAPVPVNKPAERKQLQAHWEQLDNHDPLVQAKAVFALLDHPRAVEFLADKLPPVSGDADQLKAWMKDLNSGSETVWRAAFEKLQYHDPRTGMSADEQMELMTTDNGRRLFTSLWYGYEVHIEPGTTRTYLTRGFAGNTPYIQFTAERQSRGSHSYQLNVSPVKDLCPSEWRRAAVAAHVLHARDTKAARTALARLADGAAEALPTRTAAELLNAKAAVDAKAVDAAWADLGGYDSVAVGRAVFTLTRAEAAAHLRAKLPAIKATKEQVSGWLKALNDSDPAVWKPAFEKLTYFPPPLALSAKEQCDLITTDHGRSALWGLREGNEATVPDKISVLGGCSLTCAGDLLTFSSTTPGGGRCTWVVGETPLAELDLKAWQRARVAILALERAGTKEAKAALKQLADGHPDIRPTKDAKAALQRLK